MILNPSIIAFVRLFCHAGFFSFYHHKICRFIPSVLPVKMNFKVLQVLVLLLLIIAYTDGLRLRGVRATTTRMPTLPSRTTTRRVTTTTTTTTRAPPVVNDDNDDDYDEDDE